MTDAPFQLDTPEDWFFLFLGALLAFGGLFYFGGYNYVNEQYSAYQASKLSPYFGEDVYFTQVQLTRLDEDFSNTGFEVAYCGTLDGNKVLKLRVASIRYASGSEIAYSCREYELLTLHLHPSGLAYHSDVDKEGLKWSSKEGTSPISCVYGGTQTINCISYNPETDNFLSHRTHITREV